MTERQREPGHRPIDHTGDVAVELWAPTEEELLREAARAAAGILTAGSLASGAPSIDTTIRDVRLDTIDREDRLVQWLNEVIYLAIYERLLVCDADIDLRDEALIARVRATPLPPGALATELKSATYHDLRVERDDDGQWRARVVIDV